MKCFLKKYNFIKWKVIIFILLIAPASVFAAGPPKTSELANPLAIILLVIIVGLLLVIALLANIVINGARVNLQRFMEEKKRNAIVTKVVSALLFCLIGNLAFAAETPTAQTAVADSAIAGLSLLSFYALLTVIFLEILILIVLLFNLKKLLSQEEAFEEQTQPEGVIAAKKSWLSGLFEWWERMNRFRPIKEEAQIDLGHDYDGIHELDNRLPPWWLYGFYLCIIFAGIYLYRYHVAHSAPLSGEEFKIEMVKADIEKQEYLKKSANNVDENTVKLLTNATDLEAAKQTFVTVCAACHRPDGGGNVGPNLTDDYWLHGGGIKDIFKTIKYGWPEKGMKSWKDDYSPLQIEQLASYVKSLHGSHPVNPKDPQGTLYSDRVAPDSAKTKADSIKTIAVKTTVLK
jgi:cytochrome c oxidase cbb3-type subunit 3